MKPVAWMYEHRKGKAIHRGLYFHIDEIAEGVKVTPLYTAPSDEVTKLLQEKDTKIHSLSCENKFLKDVVQEFESMFASKQLSDKEIIELGRKLGMYGYGYIDDPSGKCLDFARAILKKASEK